MDRLGVQAAHHFCDVVLLKKADPGNASRARIKTGTSVLDSHATECKHRDFLLTSFAQRIETGSAGVRDILFFENWGEQGKIGTLKCSPSNLDRGMTRDTDQCAGTLSAGKPNFLHVRW